MMIVAGHAQRHTSASDLTRGDMAQDVASLARKGRCFTQYALLCEPQSLGNALTAYVVRGGP